MDPIPFEIDDLDGYDFEEFVAKVMTRSGYSIKAINKSKDKGKDIVMAAPNGQTVIVECKHQKSVGRPVVQKLQGAMVHEQTLSLGGEVAGMVVTSGVFSNEAFDYVRELEQKIELIDGKKLQALCLGHNMRIINGKIQLVSKFSCSNLTPGKATALLADRYTQVNGHQFEQVTFAPWSRFDPFVFFKFKVAYDADTSRGTIYSHNESGVLMIDGQTGELLPAGLIDLCSGTFYSQILPGEATKMPFGLSEEEIEEKYTERLSQGHSRRIDWTGRNNVKYSKVFVPDKRNITIKDIEPFYIPHWFNTFKIKEMEYHQEFYSNDKGTFFSLDGLKICKICSSREPDYSAVMVCPDCGRVVCRRHGYLDFLDSKTPICTLHVRRLRLFIEFKRFASDQNRDTYQSWWRGLSPWRKVWEDKIVLGILGIVSLGILVEAILRTMPAK